MRIGGRKVHTGRLPLLPIFLGGLALGIIVMNLGKGLLLDNTGLLDEYTLYRMKYMTVDGNALFLYVLQSRLKSIALLAIMATTYLGLVTIGGFTAWYGMSAGMFLSALVIRYGIKGVLLALTGIFPQYLLYVPAIVCLMTWCEQTCRSIYFRTYAPQDQGIRQTIPKRLIQLLSVTAVVIIGCVLESYVNPFLVTNLLKIF